MPLYLLEWKLATEVAVFSGKFIAIADDDAHAIERCRGAIGPEGKLAAFTCAKVGNVVYELSRNERMADWMPSGGIPGDTGPREMFAFEIGARANVIASTEKVAMTRMGNAIREGSSDGKQVTLLKVKVLDRENISVMSAKERNLLSTSFRKVAGGGVSPR